MVDPTPPSIRDHLANERTLLAWIRTSVTVVGLGFVLDRLALPSGGSVVEAFAGVALVLFGASLAVAGGYSYLLARRELMTGTFQPAVRLHLFVVGAVVAGALLVAALLIAT